MINKEISNNIRKLIIDYLVLISSKELQIKYQEIVPIADVSAELFCQWNDSYYPDGDIFKNGFDNREMKALESFDSVYNDVCNDTPDELPSIYKFIVSDEWNKLNKAAVEALKIFPAKEISKSKREMFTD